MNLADSLRKIAKMPAKDRLELARQKLSDAIGEGLVSSVLRHLRDHENTRWLVYESHLAGQIPASHAAHAFMALQASTLHYEVIRLCSFWDKADLDGRSIPTIVALADCPKVSRLAGADLQAHYDQMHAAWGRQYGLTGRWRLRVGVRSAKEVSTSETLRNVRNYRGRLAHQLARTSAERQGPLPLPRFGDERLLLEKTIEITQVLQASLNGQDHDWQSSRDISRGHAEALWKGVRIAVLR